jgi:hypothetical protein
MTATITPTTIADLSPAAIVALSKMLTEKVIDDARDQLEAGELDVELVLHLRGTLEIEEDESVQQVNRLDPLTLFQIAFEKLNGVSMDAVIAEACKRLQAKNDARLAKQKELETLAGGKPVKLPKVEDEPDVREFKEKVAKAYKKLARKTTQRRRGEVVFTGDLTPAEA